MNKLWIGITVLAVLLGLGMGSSVLMKKIHTELNAELNQAAVLAETRWEDAKTLAGSAREKWDRSAHFVAALTDHAPVEEMDGLFAELEVYERQADKVCFAVTCVRIAGLAQTLGESHSLYWWNLL